MTFRWDPSGSARLAFFEEKKNAASVSQELIPDNLNADLLLIQQWAINEDLGSGLFFRALELIRSMKPGMQRSSLLHLPCKLYLRILCIQNC